MAYPDLIIIDDCGDEHRPKNVKDMTNVEFITHLMEFSSSGPLMQMFVVDALTKWTDIVAASSPSEYPASGFISGEAWIRCAKAAQRRLDEKYGTVAPTIPRRKKPGAASGD